VTDNLLPKDSLNASIRVTNNSDSPSILAWRNNKDVRKWSRNQDVIDQTEHEKWFQGWLEPNHNKGYFFVIESAALKLGMIRFDARQVHEFEVSVIVDPGYQNRGIARTAIDLALREIKLREQTFSVLATIHARNLSSIALFTSIGYHQTVFEEEFLQFRNDYKLDDFK
jgi:RimJ/RimL family protein N-acetyltransferase